MLGFSREEVGHGVYPHWTISKRKTFDNNHTTNYMIAVVMNSEEVLSYVRVSNRVTWHCMSGEGRLLWSSHVHIMSLWLWADEWRDKAFLPKEATQTTPKGKWLDTPGKKGLCGLSILSKHENHRKWDWKGSQGYFVQGFVGYEKVFRHYPECSVKPLKDFSEVPFALWKLTPTAGRRMGGKIVLRKTSLRGRSSGRI